MYNAFFPELFEIDIQEEGADSIVIPTASFESGIERFKDKFKQGLGIYPLSVENIHKSASCPSALYRSLTSGSDFTDTSGYSSAGRSLKSQNVCDNEYIESYSGLRPDTASVINLKTGSSVISFDYPNSQSCKSASSNARKSGNQKSKKAKGAKKSTKDTTRKPKRVVKESSTSVQVIQEPVSTFTDALCITPIPSQREQQEDEFENGSLECDDDDDFFEYSHDPLLYQELARQIKSVYKFDKVAYPDLCGAKSPYDVEGLYHRKFGVQR